MAQWDASDMFKQMYGEYSVFRLIKAIAQHTCTISGGALRTIDKYIYILDPKHFFLYVLGNLQWAKFHFSRHRKKNKKNIEKAFGCTAKVGTQLFSGVDPCSVRLGELRPANRIKLSETKTSGPPNAEHPLNKCSSGGQAM